VRHAGYKIAGVGGESHYRPTGKIFHRFFKYFRLRPSSIALPRSLALYKFRCGTSSTPTKVDAKSDILEF
jgi:hypothetical protein